MVPLPPKRCHLRLGGRCHRQAAVAPKYRQADAFIARCPLPGTAISIIVGFSRLFVMLKRADWWGGDRTRQREGEEGAHMASGLKYVPYEFFPFCRSLSHT